MSEAGRANLIEWVEYDGVPTASINPDHVMVVKDGNGNEREPLEVWPRHCRPDCSWCGHRSSETFRCARCEHRFTVDGTYWYQPQGKGHFHRPDGERWPDGDDLDRAMDAHRAATGCGGAFLPVSMGGQAA